MVLVVLAAITAANSARAEDPAPAGWKLVWSDEFNGQAIDPAKWAFDTGNGFYNYDANQWISGWGNSEFQYYTRAPENAFIKDGALHIRVLKESLHGCGYTSARLKTRKSDGQALFATTYGRVEFRAKLPTGQGIWPALWLLPVDARYGGWPASGEIDVLEARGQAPRHVLGTLHFGGKWPELAQAGGEYDLPAGQSIADFHVYGLEWLPGRIRWLVDGKAYKSQSFWWSRGEKSGARGPAQDQGPAQDSDGVFAWPAPFDQPFFLVMNLAVGGKFAGNPDRSTVFPAEMVVDYVRVYDRVGGYGKPAERGAGTIPRPRP